MNAAALILALVVGAADDRPLLDALRRVETGDRANPPDGDGGKALGPYQIWESYWKDSGVPGTYEQCRDREYSERVIRAYWRRYCPRGTWEQKARVHNGGPTGARKRSTEAYWRKVKRELERTGK